MLRPLALDRSVLVSMVVLLAVVTFAGCTTRRQGVDMSGFKAAMANPVSGFGARGEAARGAVLSTPETVVLARVSAHARSEVNQGGVVVGQPNRGPTRVTGESRTATHYGDSGTWYSKDDLPDMPWVVDEGVNDGQDLLALSGSKSARVVLMSQLVNTPTRMPTQNIMDTANNRGAQWLCVFSAQTEYDRGGFNPLQILTIGLLPTTSDAKSEVEAIIIDLQTNTVVDQWKATETGWQPAIGWTLGEASEQSADRAETRAMRAVMQRLDRRIRGEADGEVRRGNAGMWE